MPGDPFFLRCYSYLRKPLAADNRSPRGAAKAKLGPSYQSIKSTGNIAILLEVGLAMLDPFSGSGSIRSPPSSLEVGRQ